MGDNSSRVMDQTDQRREQRRGGPSPHDDLRLPTTSRPSAGRWVLAGAVVLVVALFVQSLARNEQMDWPVIGEYMFDGQILNGVRITLELAVYSMLIALVLGVTVAICRLSDNPVLSKLAWVYVWFFRGLPLLVLLVIWFNVSLLYPRLGFGVPFDSDFATVPTNALMSPFWAAVIAFALHESAYASEIIRGSIIAIDRGQKDAALSLGMYESTLLRRIILPQAFRIAVPPLANDFINVLKSTSLVAFIAVFDLMYTAQSIYQATFQIMPLLMVASFWYLILVSVLSLLQGMLERRLRRVRRVEREAPVDEGGRP